MQKRRKSRDVNTPPTISAKRVFREAVFKLKYDLWIERMKFVRGESDFETLHRKANTLIAAIEARRDLMFPQKRRHKWRLAAAELIASPFF